MSPNLKYLSFLTPCIFLFLLLFPFPEFHTTFNWNSSCDALHLPLFFAATFILHCILKKHVPHLLNPSLTSALTLFIVGIIIEIIQPFFDRGFSIKDIGVNILGITCCYFYISDHKNKKKLLTYSTILSLIAVSLPIYNSYLLYRHRISNFPVLFDPSTELFELASPTFKSKLDFNIPNCGMLIEPSKIEYSGVKIDLGYSNWKDFKYLVISLTNPNDIVLELALRIDDSGNNKEFESRYNDVININPYQKVNLEIPISQIEKRVTAKKFNIQSLDQALLFPANSAIPFCIEKMELR